jgi:DNA polymerase III alpha subunit
LQDVENGRHVCYCGIVTLSQQPDTAGGTIFLSFEDETGVVQVVCWKRIRETQQLGTTVPQLTFARQTRLRSRNARRNPARSS